MPSSMPTAMRGLHTTLPYASSGTKKVCFTLPRAALAPVPMIGGQCTHTCSTQSPSWSTRPS